MKYLYGSKPGMDRKLVAFFDSEPRLLSYVVQAIGWDSLDGPGTRESSHFR